MATRDYYQRQSPYSPSSSFHRYSRREEDDDNDDYQRSSSGSTTSSYYNPTRLLPNRNHEKEETQYSYYDSRSYNYQAREEDLTVTDLTYHSNADTSPTSGAHVDLTELYNYSAEEERVDDFLLEDHRYTQRQHQPARYYQDDDRVSRMRRESDLVDHIDLTQVPSILDDDNHWEAQSLPPSQFGRQQQWYAQETNSPMSLPNNNGGGFIHYTERTTIDLVIPTLEDEEEEPPSPLTQHLKSQVKQRQQRDTDPPGGCLKFQSSLVEEGEPPNMVMDPPEGCTASAPPKVLAAKPTTTTTTTTPTTKQKDCPAIILRTLSSPAAPSSPSLQVKAIKQLPVVTTEDALQQHRGFSETLPIQVVEQEEQFHEIIVIDSPLMESTSSTTSSSSSASNGRESRDPTSIDNNDESNNVDAHQPPSPPTTERTASTANDPIRTWMPSQHNLTTVMRGIIGMTGGATVQQQEEHQHKDEEASVSESLLSHLLNDSVHSQSLPTNHNTMIEIVANPKQQQAVQEDHDDNCSTSSSSFGGENSTTTRMIIPIFTPKQRSFDLDRQETLSDDQVYCDDDQEESPPTSTAVHWQPLELQKSITNDTEEEENTEDATNDILDKSASNSISADGLDAEATYAAFCFSDEEQPKEDSEPEPDLESEPEPEPDVAPELQSEPAILATTSNEENSKSAPPSSLLGSLLSNLWEDKASKKEEVVTDDEGARSDDILVLDEHDDAKDYTKKVVLDVEPDAEQELLEDLLQEQASSFSDLSAQKKRVSFRDDIEEVNIIHPFKEANPAADAWGMEMTDIADETKATRKKKKGKRKKKKKSKEVAEVKPSLPEASFFDDIWNTKMAGIADPVSRDEDDTKEKVVDEPNQAASPTVPGSESESADVLITSDETAILEEKRDDAECVIGSNESNQTDEDDVESDMDNYIGDVLESEMEQEGPLQSKGTDGIKDATLQDAGEAAPEATANDELVQEGLGEELKQSPFDKPALTLKLSDFWDATMAKTAEAENATGSNESSHKAADCVSSENNDTEAATEEKSACSTDGSDNGSIANAEELLAASAQALRESLSKEAADAIQLEEEKVQSQLSRLGNYRRTSALSIAGSKPEKAATPDDEGARPCDVSTHSWHDPLDIIADLTSTSTALSIFQDELEPLSFIDGGSGNGNAMLLPSTYTQESSDKAMNQTGAATKEQKEVVAYYEEISEMGSEDQFCGNGNGCIDAALPSNSLLESKEDSIALSSIPATAVESALGSMLSVRDEASPENLNCIDLTSVKCIDQTQHDAAADFNIIAVVPSSCVDEAEDTESSHNAAEDSTSNTPLEETLEDTEATHLRDSTKSAVASEVTETNAKNSLEETEDINTESIPVLQELTQCDDEKVPSESNNSAPMSKEQESESNLAVPESISCDNTGEGSETEDVDQEFVEGSVVIEVEPMAPSANLPATPEEIPEAVVGLHEMANLAVAELTGRVINLSFDGSKQSEVSALHGPPVETNDKNDTSDATLDMECLQVLVTSLMTHKYGFEFSTPLDVSRFPDYNEEDSKYKPLDLGTVLRNLINGNYSTILDFQADVNMTFAFRMKHSEKGSKIYKWAKTLKKKFEKDLLKLLDDLENELTR